MCLCRLCRLRFVAAWSLVIGTVGTVINCIHPRSPWGVLLPIGWFGWLIANRAAQRELKSRED